MAGTLSQLSDLRMEGDSKPSTSAAPPSLTVASAPSEKGPSLGRGRILIVDDEQGIRCFLSYGLGWQDSIAAMPQGARKHWSCSKPNPSMP